MQSNFCYFLDNAKRGTFEDDMDGLGPTLDFQLEDEE